MLLDNLPNNSSIRKFGCATYLHIHKERLTSMVADHAQLGIHLGNRYECFRIDLWKQNRVVQTKHVSFDETWYPRQKKEIYVILSQPEQNTEYVTPTRNEMRVSHIRSEELSVSASTNHQEEADEVANEIVGHVERLEVEEGTTSMGAGGSSDSLSMEHSVEPRYPRREHKASVRFTTNALKRVRLEAESTTKEALAGPETRSWKPDIETEIRTLSEMSCCTVVDIPLKEKLLHSKFIFRRKQDEKGVIQRYKARFVVCCN